MGVLNSIMDGKLLISALLLVILAIMPFVSGIQCHRCDSRDNITCMDPFLDEITWEPKTMEFLVECPGDYDYEQFCLKYTYKDGSVKRSCGSGKIDFDYPCQADNNGNFICQCFFDHGCNSVALYSLSSLAVFSPLLLAYLMQ